LEKIASALEVEPMDILNFDGKEFKALIEGPPENLE